MTKSWKVAEARIAAFVGSVRTALSGSNSKVTASDTHHPKLFIEVKQRRSHAVWSLYDKVKRLACKEGKIPLIALDRYRSPGAIICIHTDDLELILQELVSIRLRKEDNENQKEIKTGTPGSKLPNRRTIIRKRRSGR